LHPSSGCCLPRAMDSTELRAGAPRGGAAAPGKEVGRTRSRDRAPARRPRIEHDEDDKWWRSDRPRGGRRRRRHGRPSDPPTRAMAGFSEVGRRWILGGAVSTASTTSCEWRRSSMNSNPTRRRGEELLQQSNPTRGAAVAAGSGAGEPSVYPFLRSSPWIRRRVE
jgi:hypothetical protein